MLVNSALVRLVQSLNAHSPMLITLSGMVMEVSPVQSLNAYSPMLVTLEGMVMEVKLVQPRNALRPILVTLYVLFSYIIDIGIITSFPPPQPITSASNVVKFKL